MIFKTFRPLLCLVAAAVFASVARGHDEQDHPDRAGPDAVSPPAGFSRPGTAGGAERGENAPDVPTNDNFANAATITLNNNFAQLTGSNIGATKEPGEPNHAGDPGGHSVWWKWTPSVSGVVGVDTSGSNFDTTLGVYTGATVSTLATICSNDDAPGGGVVTSAVTFNATAGTTYFIAVDGKGGATGTTLALNLTEYTPPSFYSQPGPQAVDAGQPASYYAYAIGDPPPVYQWQRLPAGAGSWANLSDTGVYTGTSTSFLTVVSATTGMDGDQFRCVASNIAGAATSVVATLSVSPAVAPVIFNLPATLTINYGDYLGIVPSITGTQPLTLQWMKNGVAIPGATIGSYSQSNASAADAGQYVLTASNLAGSATSTTVTVIVNAPVLPAIFNVPATIVVNFGDNLSISPSVTGSQPIVYQWNKDGVALPSGTGVSFNKGSATATDAGHYTLTATNIAGSTTSTTVVVTVNPATPPAVFNLPSGIAVNYGDFLSISPSIAGTQPITFQWKKDGVPLPNGTASNYSKQKVTTADSGQYTVTATNVAGSVTSSAVTVTVNPPVAPVIFNLPASITVNYGDSLGIIPSIVGTPPLTFQWKKDGVVLAGATGSFYSKNYVTTADSGQYTLTATNLAGTVTSAAVAVTVNGAVGPGIFNLPTSLTVNYGDSLGIFATVTGTPPMTFQWNKNGVALAGATYSSYSDNYVTLADSGQYTLVATNLVGTVTSAPVNVTVNPALLPSITNLPPTITLNYGDYLSITPTVTGTQPMTFQWKKDGVAISGATNNSYSINYVTTPDAGHYTLTATNLVGTVASTTVAVVVNPAVAPTISQQPVSVTVARGLSAGFSVIGAGTNPLNLQWYFNGQAIPGATGNSYYVDPAAAANAGCYTVTLTNLAGTVTSTAAMLTVLPPTLPKVGGWPASPQIINNGSSLNLYLYDVEGSPPFTFQWYKDGVAIPGATGANYTNSTPTPADAGIYTVQVSNGGGMTASPDITVIWSDPTATAPWIDAVRLGNVVYFLAASSGQIWRYDLVQESWLPAVSLDANQVPTAFLPTAQGVFVAYGQNLVVRTLDLQTETALTTSTTSVNCLFSFGNFIYFQDGANVRSFKVADLSAGPTFVPSTYFFGNVNRTTRPVFSVALNCGFTASQLGTPAIIGEIQVAADGTFQSGSASPYAGVFAVGAQQYVSPDGQFLVDGAGLVYHTSDLTYKTSLGSSIDDLTYLDDGTPVVLRGDVLAALDPQSFLETGRVVLGAQGFNLFNRAGATYVFGAPASAGGNPSVAKVLVADFAPASPPMAADPNGAGFSIEDSFLGADGTIDLVSRSLHGLVRWDPQANGFLPTLPFRGNPSFSSYAPAANRLVLAYPDGTLTNFLFSTDSLEHAFATISVANSPFALVAMDDLTELNVQDAQDSGNDRIVLGAQGDSRFLYYVGFNYGPGVAWQSANRRLYSTDPYSSDVLFESVPTSGFLPGQNNSGVANVAPPLRFNSDGSLLLSTSGYVFNGDLSAAGAIANPVTDGAWLAGGLYTVRPDPNGTQIQGWALGTYAPGASLVLPGLPIRIFRLDDSTLAVVTLVNGYAAFYVVSSDLALVRYSINASFALLAPVVSTQTQSQNVPVGTSATFTFVAIGAPGPTYQWQRLPAGGNAWVNLSDGSGYTGTATTSLTVGNANLAMNSDQFRCVATNSAGSATSNPAVLSVYAFAADFNGDHMSDLLWQDAISGDRIFWLMNGTAPAMGQDLATLPTDWSIAAIGDFNGDGSSDLVWQNTVTGERLIWLMNGTTPITAVSLGAVSTDWLIVGTGDMNGDGQTDLLWTNTVTGERLIWLMNGTTPFNAVSLGVVPFQWALAGTGDFNTDGHTDLVWDNTLTGEISVWLMNGTTPYNAISLGSVSPQLQIAGIGDYNGDGQPDILWTNRFTGERTVWLMNGTTHASTVSLATLPLNWVLVHPVAHRVWADFNSDGKSDLIWQNTATGEALLYLMNGTTPFNAVSLGTADPNVQIAATGDFNADGKADLVWQNSATGERTIWLMNGPSLASSVSLGLISTDWSIVGTGDFNADGYSDLVWKNTVTGEYVIWLMNGTTPVNGISLGVIDPNLQFAGTGDFNADGSTDLLWQNTATGERLIWLMNGTTMSSSVSLGTISTDWSLTGTGDFNADGQTDLIWTNLVTGERLIWLMNGVTPFNGISLGNYPTDWVIRN